MKKVLVLISVLFLFTSCDIEYDGETKIIVTGTIVDENDLPLSEKDIEVNIGEGGGFLSPSFDLISFGKSDENGNFTLVFPAPSSDYPITIHINSQINEGNGFQDVTILANKSNFENYKLDIKDITLFKNESITSLRLILNKTSSITVIKDLKLEGKIADSYLDLNQKQYEPDYIETNYSVVKNQTLFLKYTVFDYSNSSNQTSYSVPIQIVNNEVTYTITY